MNRNLSLFLMAAMVLQPILYFVFMGRFGVLGSIFSSADEIMLGGFASLSLLYILHAGKIPKHLLVWVVFIVYAITLCFYRGLPSTSYLQILLDSKIYFYGLAAWLLMRSTYQYDAVVIGIFKFLIFLSVVFSIWQIISPGSFYSFIQIADQTRQGSFSTVSGVFQSRVAFAQFLIIAILLFSANSPTKHLTLVILIALLFMSFSRKEILFFLFGYAYYYVLMSEKIRIISKFWIVSAALSITVAAGFVLWSYSSTELSEDYVRYIMWNSATEIIGDNFPVGTGPGTYGSLMSLLNSTIYDAYNVSDRIVHGYGLSPFDRGPIFDLFLINLTVEYGVGIILPLLYIYFYGRGYQISADKRRAILVLKIFLVYSSILTPAFSNPTAFLTFIAISSIVYKCRHSDHYEAAK